jgi:hypothetical protein
LPTVIVRRSFTQLEMRLVSTAGNGLPVNVVQRVMGHQQASTTLNRYTDAPADYDDRVRAALDASADFSLTSDPPQDPDNGEEPGVPRPLPA